MKRVSPLVSLAALWLAGCLSGPAESPEDRMQPSAKSGDAVEPRDHQPNHTAEQPNQQQQREREREREQERERERERRGTRYPGPEEFNGSSPDRTFAPSAGAVEHFNGSEIGNGFKARESGPGDGFLSD